MDTEVSGNKVISAQTENLKLTPMILQNELATDEKMADMDKQASETANRKKVDAEELEKWNAEPWDLEDHNR